MILVHLARKYSLPDHGETNDSHLWLSEMSPSFELRLLLDQCKFYPAKPLAVLAGSVIASQSPLLQPKDRCLVDCRSDVQSLLERWANDSGSKKCTGWVRLAVPLEIICDIVATETIEKNRNLGALMLKATKVHSIRDPQTYELKILLEQVKFYPTKLAVLDGTVDDAEDSSDNHSYHLLKKGEKCWIHLRTNVIPFMKTLKGITDSNSQNNNATGWIKFAEPIAVTCSIMITPGIVERNRKGALMLECFEIVALELPGDGELITMKMSEKSFRSNADVPTLFERKDRHRVFAKWLVDKYGIDFLSSGTGVLDVAGGKGELSQALFDLGVRRSILLDPHPRCDSCEGEKIEFHIIQEPLDEDGSLLTDRVDEVGNLSRNCSIIAGMHPDQATEAIVDMSLRLGKPFAILPCCVMPKLFPNRVQKRHGDPVRSYNTFCQYLLDKSPAGVPFLVEYLPFQGRNKVIYIPELKYCQIIHKKSKLDE